MLHFPSKNLSSVLVLYAIELRVRDKIMQLNEEYKSFSRASNKWMVNYAGA